MSMKVGGNWAYDQLGPWRDEWGRRVVRALCDACGRHFSRTLSMVSQLAVTRLMATAVLDERRKGWKVWELSDGRWREHSYSAYWPTRDHVLRFLVAEVLKVAEKLEPEAPTSTISDATERLCEAVRELVAAAKGRRGDG